MQLLLYRFYTDNSTTTVGRLIVSDITYYYDTLRTINLSSFQSLPNIYSCFTIELDWKNNKRNESCIPAGFYAIEDHYSQKFKNVLLVKDVPNRDGILLHKGNSYENSRGCILPVRRIEIADNVYGYSSKFAFDNMMKFKTNIKSLLIIDKANYDSK